MMEWHAQKGTVSYDDCKPYIIWKTSVIGQTVMLFICGSFALGTCETFLNEDDREIREANE